MTDHDQDAERSTADRSHPTRPAVTESEKFFEAERLEESRKRFATYSLWAGLLSLLLLLIPNPFPWLFGPVAILLGIHALVRMVLQPTHHAGKVRAVVGIIMGLVATTACRPWSNVLRYTHRRAVCESSLREIAQGLRQYHQDWEAFPPNLQTLIQAGHVIPSQCQCFIEEQLGEAEPDFAYVAGLQSDDPEDWIWLFDAPVNHNGRGGIILYLSGETGHFGPEAFEAELQRFRGQYERERSRPPRIVLPG